MLCDRHNIIYSDFVNERLSPLTNPLAVSLTASARVPAKEGYDYFLPNRIDVDSTNALCRMLFIVSRLPLINMSF